jgi:hypothetical protein
LIYNKKSGRINIMSETLPSPSSNLESDQFQDAELKIKLDEAIAVGGAPYRLLRLPKQELASLKLAFEESDMTLDPDLTPSAAVAEKLDAREAKLLSLKDYLLSNEPEGSIKRAYRWRINELIAGARMTRAAANGDTRRFKWYNEFVYGPVDSEVFISSNEYFRNMAAKFVDSEHVAVANAANHLINTLPSIHGPASKNLLPGDEEFAHVKNLHADFFNSLLEGVKIPEEGFSDYVSADEQTLQIMSNLGISDYELVDQTDVSTWEVRNRKKQVARPTKTTGGVSAERYKGLVAGHELGTHVAEYQNGLEQNIGLIAAGFDRAAGAGEGKATIREQIVYESAEGLAQLVRYQDIIRRHYSISLGAGLAGEPMSFSEVYEVVNAIDRLWETLQTPQDPDGANDRADKRTWTLLATRTLKGTDGMGGAYYKDKVYLESNLAYWQLAKSHPELTKYWDMGNVDMTNPRHVSLLIELGIINDQDLD